MGPCLILIVCIAVLVFVRKLTVYLMALKYIQESHQATGMMLLINGICDFTEMIPFMGAFFSLFIRFFFPSEETIAKKAQAIEEKMADK